MATVDSSGNITAKKLGKATITVKTVDGNYTASYNITVKQKTIIVVTASAGKRMYDWFKTYTSKNSFYYNFNDASLKYIYKSGSGFEYQYGEGLELAKDYINEHFSNTKNYVELSLFFTLTGNSVNNLTCDKIQTSNEYLDIATNYNNAIQQVKDLGYKNTKGYVISHSPLNTKQAIKEYPERADYFNIVYSHDSNACSRWYRSAWKYWLSNRRMESVLKNGNYSNLTFIDNFSNFVVIKDESARTFTWLRNYTTTDALHWDEPTTKEYMQLAFDTAGM